jgi:hypothetical protein
VLWPTLGNHDAVSSSTLDLTGPYYDSFTLPDGAEAGGVSSGTEAYYSFDFANIHFICLNSQETNPFTPFVPDMLAWLEADLMDTAQDWIVAYWHHPPYSKGSHDSDNPADSGGRLRDMRENVLPLLEGEGVDLVLAGHSHSYERSFLLDGHYDVSDTLTPGMMLDAGDGRVDGTGAYQKATPGPAPHEGAVYVVAGSSGQITGGDLNHPAMFVSFNELGSVVLDVDGHRMDLTFLNNLGVVRDELTLVKDTGTLPVADFQGSPTVGAAPLAVDFTDLSTTNTASWSWDLDGDAGADSAARHPNHVYASTGFYTVSLTATNNTGSHQETKAGHVCVSDGVPDQVSGFAADADQQTFSWDVSLAADHYDVVKGDLGQLGQSGGDFSVALLACLEEDDTDEQATDSALPAAGEGYFYVVRAQSLCDESGTYDSGGPAQIGSRDEEIQSAPQTCN